MTDHELEAKFECTVADAGRLSTLSELAGFALLADGERTQVDLYFDSPERLLRSNSASLRLRRIDDNTLLATYKGPRELVDAGGGAQIVKRQEIEHPVSVPAGMTADGDLPAEVLAGTSALEHAEAAFGRLNLEPTARLVTQRRTKRFGRGDEAELELALDQVAGTGLEDGRFTEFAEVELESLNGDVSALMDAITALRVAYPSLQPSDTTKLGRVLD